MQEMGKNSNNVATCSLPPITLFQFIMNISLYIIHRDYYTEGTSLEYINKECILEQYRNTLSIFI